MGKRTKTQVSAQGTACVGRERELKELSQRYAKVVAQHKPRVVTLVGVQGVGKTRLIDEWLSSQHETPTRVLRVTAHGANGSYALIRRLLSERFGFAEKDGASARLDRLRAAVTEVFSDKRMTEVIHFLGRFLGLRSDDNAFLRALSADEGDDSISRTILRRFFELDAARSPLVIVLDDLHLADDDSLALLEDLTSQLRAGDLFLLAIGRPELFSRRPAWGQEQDKVHSRMEIGSLEAAAAEELLRHHLAGCELPETWVKEVCARGAGNPLLLVESARLLEESGAIVDGEGGPRLDLERARTIELPFSVEAARDTQIALLSKGERGLLERAAALGSTFWLGQLETVSRFDVETGDRSFSTKHRDDLSAQLGALCQRNYLLPVQDGALAAEPAFAFADAAVGALLVRRMAPDAVARVALHGAEWLAAKLPLADGDVAWSQRLELLASLYERSGQPALAALAAATYLRAGQAARAHFAIVQAAKFIGRALELGVADARERFDALHDYGDVLQRTGETKAAMAAFQAMLKLAWRLDFPAKGGAALSRIARVHRALGEYESAETELKSALELFRSVDDARGVAGVEDDLGKIAFLRGDFPHALERCRRALELRRQIGDKRSIALSTHNVALVHQASGHYADAVQHFVDALELRKAIGDRSGVVQSLLAMAQAWRDQGHLQRAYDILIETLTLAREIGDRVEEANILVRLGDLQFRLARAAEACDLLGQAARLAEAFGDRPLQSEAARLLAEISLELGYIQAARTEARRALELAEAVHMPTVMASAHRTLGRIFFRSELASEKLGGREHFQRAVDLLEGMGAENEFQRTCEELAALLTAEGDSVGASEWSRRAHGTQPVHEPN